MRHQRTENSRNKRKNTLPRFIAVDFFCGAGGTTCGLIGAGGYVVAGIDKDERVGKTYRQNNRNRTFDRAYPHFLNMDIFPKQSGCTGGQQVELFEKLDEALEPIKTECPTVPLLFAICAPCQPFTTLSRKRLSAKRERERSRDSGLLREALEFVRVYEPQYVLSENVAGVSDVRYGGVWQAFSKGLEALGYMTGSRVVDASRFGIAQYRKRSILLAVKGASFVGNGAAASSMRIFVPDANLKSRPITARDAIVHFPKMEAGRQHAVVPNHKTRSLSELNQRRIAVAKPGEPNIYLEKTKYGDLSLPCHRRVNDRLKQRCFTDVYTRMHPDRPSPTITTKCHSISNGRFGHFDIRQQRGISLREAAALQSFPDAYVFHPVDKIGQVASMIGNAVPPKLARFFANYLVSGKAVDSAFYAGP